MAVIPSGFESLPHADPYLDNLGGFKKKESDNGWIVGVLAEPKHCNGRKIVHGGFLSTLADVCISYGCTYSQTPPLHMVTAHQSIDFLGMAKEGDWRQVYVFCRCRYYGFWKTDRQSEWNC